MAGINLYFAIDGNKDFRKKMDAAKELYRDAFFKGVYSWGQQIKQEARENCPTDTGALQASIYVTQPPAYKTSLKLGDDVVTRQGSRAYIVAAETAIKRQRNALKTGLKYHPRGLGEPRNRSGVAKILRESDIDTTRKRVGAAHREIGTKKNYNLGTRTGEQNAIQNRKISRNRYGDINLNKTHETVKYSPTINPVAPTTGEDNRYSVAVGASVYYAVYVEYGTRYMPAQPFLRPAMMNIRFDDIVDRIMDAAEAQIQKDAIKRSS
jgi:HK97 gp10 family phage protein